MTEVAIRPATSADAGVCARVMYAAFESLATRHAFPIEPQTPEFTGMQMEFMLATDGIYGLVAERDGDVVGSAFADERGRIVGIGPVSVDPATRGGGGRTDEDIIALLADAETIVGLGVLVPSRNARLMAWCFESGLRLVQQSTLMTIGLYNDPQGSWLPSIGY